MLQQHREFMTLKTWKFTVTEHLIATSFEGKRARTRFPWAINKLRRFKYLSVWADDHLLLLSFWGSIAETRTHGEFKDFCSNALTCLELTAHLQTLFHKCLLLPLGCCQLFSPDLRHDGLSLSSVRGSQFCMKFTRAEVKRLSLQIRAWVPHSRCIKPFWKGWLLGRSCHIQTAMNLSMFDQEFHPSERTVSKGVC